MRISSLYSLIALACVSLAALLPSTGAHAQRSTEVDSVVAVVNKEVITRVELRNRIEQAIVQLGRQGVQQPPAEVLERQVLERLIIERIQRQLAEESALRADEATLSRAIARIASNNNLSEDALRSRLEADGVTWERFREQISNDILVTRLREREVDSQIVVTEAEVDNFIATNPEAFSGQEFMVAHILLRAPESPNQEDIMRIGRRAEEVMAKLAAGEDFGRLAATYSDAPDAMNGGQIGWRTQERLPALFADALRDLGRGEVSPVIRSAAGLHIVKFVDVRGGELAGSNEVEQTRARHILLKTSEVLTDTDAESRLLGLRERILNGESFEELAKANSADLSAAKGGDLGWLNQGDTVPEFQRAMNELAPGELSGPVHSPFGWHLIQVVERRMQDFSEERKRNAARNALRARKADEANNDWLRRIRDSAYVEIRLTNE
nr:peptidylprolyl isomerase [Zoogloeaceae bacterium]